jgi:hypothetical protein
MTMNRSDDREFAKKLTGYLDLGTADLRAGTAYRLQQARANVLARLAEGGPRTAPATRYAPAFAGISGGSGGDRSVWTRGRMVVGVLLILAMGFGFHQWRLYQQVRELTELDTQILTSDLPIDAYLDRGFQAWLTSNDD